MGKIGKSPETGHEAGVAPAQLFKPWQEARAEESGVKTKGSAQLTSHTGSGPVKGQALSGEKPPVFAGYWRFLMAGLRHHEQTGAIVPSQRFLVDRMISPIPPGYRGPILELGAGTGSLTRRLAMTRPNARITAVEINPVLADLLKRALAAEHLCDRIQVVAGSAENLLSELRNSVQKPGFVISGIPLGNLDKAQVMTLMDGIHAALPEGGMYIQFQHSLLDRKKIQARFSRLRTVPVLLNFPPAFVYYAWK